MKPLLITAGLLGATAVTLGAFGAHGLPGWLADAGYGEAEIAKRLDTFATATRYHLHAALAVLAVALLGRGKATDLAAKLWCVGAVIFCGLCYALAIIDGMRWLGAIVPVGGVALIAGWAMIVAAGVRCCEEPTNDSRADRLEQEQVRLEELLTHQQKLLADLNEALTDTRSGVDETARQQLAIEQTVKRLVDLQQAAEDHPDERPPHY